VQGWWVVSYVVLWLLVVVLCAVVVALARPIGTLHLRLGPRGALEIDDEGPALGEPAPAAPVTEPDGRRVDAAEPGAARLLLFVSPGCRVCEQVLPGLQPVAEAAGLSALVISDLDRFETDRAFGGRAQGVRVVSGPEVVRAWEVPGTPYAVVLDEKGAVRAKGTPSNLEQLEGLVDSARRRAAVAGGQ
jgi:methylamine dehydrogenase accessory protein MauD